MAVYDKYIYDLHDQFGYFATWLPNSKRVLGDVGIKKGKLFEYQTSLSKLGISFNVREGDQAIDMSHSSTSGVSISFKASGSAANSSLPIDKAGAIVSFGEKGAFVFQAVNCVVYEIEDKYQLGRDLVYAYQNEDWEQDWVVVDTLVKVDRATILVSHSGSSYLELSAEKDLKAGGLSLVSADADLSISAQKGEILHIVGENQLTPLFKLSRVKLDLFEWLLGGKPEFEGVRRSAPGKGEMIDDEVAEKALEIVALDSE